MQTLLTWRAGGRAAGGGEAGVRSCPKGSHASECREWAGAGIVMPPSSWPEGAIPPQTGSLGPRSGEGGLGPAPLSLFPYLVLLHGVGCLLVSAHGAAGAAGGGHPCAHVGLTIGALEMGGGGGWRRCRPAPAVVSGRPPSPRLSGPYRASPCSTSAGGGPLPGSCLEQRHTQSASWCHTPGARFARRQLDHGSHAQPRLRLMETR